MWTSGMHLLSITSNVFAMLFAIVAAWLWYKSAIIRVPISKGNKTGPELDVGGYAFVATAQMQTTWSRRAAIAAAGAAFCQAVALATSLFAT